MPSLLLGPILRYAGNSEATIWVETSAACEVTILEATAPTFQIEGHHYALVHVRGLNPGAETEYEVKLDGLRAWPEPDSHFPPSAIRAPKGDGDLRLTFGSCRMALSHEPPFALPSSDDSRGHGIDALRALALRTAASPREARPDALLMLGDQVYTDDLSPDMQSVATSRRDGDGSPKDKLCGFSEFALAYREAWRDPAIRWLLSTVPTAMIFDDHEIDAEWRSPNRGSPRSADSRGTKGG